MKRLNKKWKIFISFLAFFSIVFYIEVLSYIIKSRGWQKLETTISDEESIRILFVADPQIQGEKDENPFLGIFTRWDIDNYLSKNFKLAKYHVMPHIIIFMGDLFDEGYKASDPEYRRYIKRLAAIYNLPKQGEISKIEYVFIPGDNDVGGIDERFSEIKLNWFNKTFGLDRVFWYKKSRWNLQFIKNNHFIPEIGDNPLKDLNLTKNEYHSVSNQVQLPDFRFFLGHLSMLDFRTTAVQTILDNLMPSLIFSAHDHFSIYYRSDVLKNDVKYITKNFLLENKKNNEGKHGTMRINLKRSSEINNVLHEIGVPTCSYRMGERNMGFGALQLYKNGTADYSVLWLPKRFNQLYFYLVIYIITKIIFTPWALWKLFFFLPKLRFMYQNWRLTQSTKYTNLVNNDKDLSV